MTDTANGPVAGITPASPVTGWTGGQKAGWFFVGFLGGIVGILLASLSNVGRPDRSTATKFAIIGMVAAIVIFFLLFFALGCSAAMVAASVASRY